MHGLGSKFAPVKCERLCDFVSSALACKTAKAQMQPLPSGARGRWMHRGKEGRLFTGLSRSRGRCVSLLYSYCVKFGAVESEPPVGWDQRRERTCAHAHQFPFLGLWPLAFHSRGKMVWRIRDVWGQPM